jgi:hypothetical protein
MKSLANPLSILDWRLGKILVCVEFFQIWRNLMEVLSTDNNP